jgi:hypothetical protein
MRKIDLDPILSIRLPEDWRVKLEFLGRYDREHGRKKLSRVGPQIREAISRYLRHRAKVLYPKGEEADERRVP